MKVFYSSRQKGFIPPNPEGPERVEFIKSFLEKKGGFEFVEAKECSKVDLLRAHSEDYVMMLERGCHDAAHGKSVWLSPDTPVFEDSFELASIAAGGSMQAAVSAKVNEPCFALVRPPGHHAGFDFGHGFCYFNNLAVAVRKAQSEGVKRVAVLDFDFHHGDGSQDIFRDDESVLHFSVQQDPLTCFPGKASNDNDHIVNVNLPSGANDAVFFEAVSKFKDLALKFKPELIGISAGFDSWFEDPVASLGVRNPETYLKVGQLVKAVASELNVPVFVVLEGGYSLNKLGELCWQFLQGLQ